MGKRLSITVIFGMIFIYVSLLSSISVKASETRGVTVIVDATDNENTSTPITPALIGTEKTGIELISYPTKQMTSQKISGSDIKACWIYTDIYSDGSKLERSSTDLVSDFILSESWLSRGDNRIFVTETETGKGYTASFIVFGNELDRQVIDGLYATYAYTSAYTTSKIQEKFLTVYYTHTDIYADGTVRRGIVGKEKPAKVTLSSTKIKTGENLYIVTDPSTGFWATFTVTGIYKAPVQAGAQTNDSEADENASSIPSSPGSISPTLPKTSGVTISAPSVIAQSPTSTTLSQALIDKCESDALYIEETGSESDLLLRVDYDWKALRRTTVVTRADLDNVDFVSPDGVIDSESVIKLITSILSDDEVEELLRGRSILTAIDISDKTEWLPDNRAMAEDLLKEGMGLGSCFSVVVSKTVDDVTTIIDQIDAPISITLALPEEMLGEGREYYVLRLSDVEPCLLRDLDDAPATVSFETDAFGAFAFIFIYEETASTAAFDDVQDPESPVIYEKSYEEIPPEEPVGKFSVFWWIWFLIIFIILAMVTAIAVKKIQEGRQ